MRTRFLNADYFNSAPIESLETTGFIRLPLPHLPPDAVSGFACVDCFDDVPLLSISPEFERLPIDAVLSKFLSDVIPQNVEFEIGDFGSEQACYGKAGFEERRGFSSNKIDDIQATEEKNVTIFDGMSNNDFKMVQFEMPELNPTLDNACFSEKEDMQLFSEVSDAEFSVDMLSPALEVQTLSEIEKSVYSVDDINSEYHLEKKADLLEDGGLVQGQKYAYSASFPLLEVDETSLDISCTKSLENELLLLEKIELQHWKQDVETMGDSKELLGCIKFDVLEYLSDHCLAKKSLEAQLSSSNFFSGMDILTVIEYSHTEGNFIFDQERPDHDFNELKKPTKFEEFQFHDLDLFQFSENFFECAMILEAETCEKMWGETMNFKNFDKLVVSHELTLVGDSFKSLPVPIILDKEKSQSLIEFVEETLLDLKPQPSSASDSIYLDWYMLDEDNFDCTKHACQKMLEEIATYSIDYDLYSNDCSTVVFDFVFSDDIDGSSRQKNEEMLNISLDMFMPHVNGGGQKGLNREGSYDINAEKISLLVESAPHFSDLDFFLNPRECTGGINDTYSEKLFGASAKFPVSSSSDSVIASASSTMPVQLWDIKLHQIRLSGEILALIDYLQEIYLVTLKNDKELIKAKYQFSTADDFGLLSRPKEMLVDSIKDSSAHPNNIIVAYATLGAIKRMAWYLCYYGIHPTYLYIEKLCRSLQCLKLDLSFLQNVIKDAHGKSDKEIFYSHPALSVVHGILQSIIGQNSSRILFVADQVFWGPLKRLLTSMKISCSELQNFDWTTDIAVDNVHCPGCCLVSHEHVSASFPFNKFSCVLEYGGACGSSRVCSLSPKSAACLPLHFLKVDLEELSASKALCEGIDMPKNMGYTTMVQDPHPIPFPDESNQKLKLLEQLLNFIPVENHNKEEVAEVEACSVSIPFPCVQSYTESKQNPTSTPSFSDTVIVVNTQNLDREMIISRRSTYQKILALEKEGAQVVERDLSLAVDIIVSAEVCLAWYDCRNIGTKATVQNEASSCLPVCVENIAANFLTSLSFAFSTCFLVFEGENSFISSIMESSDDLYAAAASLGINIQLFCSYSPEMTDEIIMNSIGYASKLSRGLYPKMHESQSLAESFLTTFPSINPLSAHAILSSGATLFEFLDWPHESRLQAVKKYHVSEESIGLFTSLCRYGEREDCKSGTTDCSSVSSAPDSGNCLPKTDSERRKRKYTTTTHDTGISMEDDLSNFEASKLFTYGQMYNSSNSKQPDVYADIGRSDTLFDDDFFKQKQDLGMNVMRNPSQVPNAYDFQMSDDKEQPGLLLNDTLRGKKQGLNVSFDRRDHVNPGCLEEDFIGEIIDVYSSSPSRKNFSMENSSLFSSKAPEMEKNVAVGTSRFGEGCFRNFPTAAELNSESDSWISTRDYGQNLRGQDLREETSQHSDIDFNYDNSCSRYCNKSSEGEELNSTINFRNPSSFTEKDVPHYGEKPFLNAVRSTEPHKGSPWTIEFLNRIREKSRLRRQSHPNDFSSPHFGHSGTISKNTKRKSPSTLELYKYQGGSMPKKSIEQKRQKRFTRPSNSSRIEKTSTSFLPILTPVDKRSRKTLSYTPSGSGGQSKLVWIDKDVETPNRRF